MSMKTRFIYADNAATTFPKPHEVLAEILEIYETKGITGRGSYDFSIRAGEFVNKVRCQVCKFFGNDDSTRVVFGYNATDALNTLIQGLIEPGCHVVSSCLEHNSVLRPLHHFSKQGIISLDLVPFDSQGFIDPEDVAGAVEPHTRFVILTHGSNVLGTIQPVERIGAICRQLYVPLILDVTQTAGIVPINMEKWGVSAVAFTGHKSLYGPTGIGGLVLSSNLDVRTTRFGGTGFDSISVIHPKTYPQRLEAGTINQLGVIGLSAGLNYLEKQGLNKIYTHEMSLIRQLINGLSSLEKVHLYCDGTMERRLPLLLCNIDGMDSEQVCTILDGDFGIAARGGLHCAPFVHRDLGTSPKGGVRFSLGMFNTADDVDRIVEAMAEISRFNKNGLRV